MSSTFDAKAIKRASTSSQPYAGSEGSAIIVQSGARLPTGSVSMMTLLLAIIECHADFAYNVVENFHALGLHFSRKVPYSCSPSFNREWCFGPSCP